ncbi:hypothetical protein EYR40_004424 [Pleurotus pulmonarius]|nr:hypothetical protein EYR40_004424 [Pleurotus pulmonarius]KAF4607126.1 hypothetical protein EYR38_001184 [Pleurotus pulmonarius]
MSIIRTRFVLLFVLAVANAALHAMAAPIFYPGASSISDEQDFLWDNDDHDDDDDTSSDVTAPIRSELPEPTLPPSGGTKLGGPSANEADESGEDDEVEESTSTTSSAPPTSAPTAPLSIDEDDELEEEGTTAATSSASSTSASTSSTSANPSPTDNDGGEGDEDEDEDEDTVTSSLSSTTTSASSATSSSSASASVPTSTSASSSSTLSTRFASSSSKPSSSVASSTTPSSITSTTSSPASSSPTSTRSSSTSPTASTTTTDDLRGTTIILTYGNTATLGLPSGVPTPAPGQSLSDAIGDKDLNDIINQLLGAPATPTDAPARPTATTSIAPTSTGVGADAEEDAEDESDATPTTAVALPGQALLPTQFRPLPSLLGQLALTDAPGPTFTPFFPTPTNSADSAAETQNDDDGGDSDTVSNPFGNSDGDDDAVNRRPDGSSSGFDADGHRVRPSLVDGDGEDDGPEDGELPEASDRTLPPNGSGGNGGGPAMINIRTSSVPAAGTFTTLQSAIAAPTATRTVKIKITIEKEE